MRNSIFILFLGIIVSLTSCRKDFDTVPSTGSLEFSKQTVYLDTVFTGISSSTYMLKVYNRSNDDITIPSIHLEKSDSKYRIMVDGMTGNNGEGKVFPNVELLAKDSLFIFIETTATIAQAEADFTYNDKIVFESGINTQNVNLVTLIQDANFIFPNRDMGTGIKETLTLGGEPTDILGHSLLTDEELNWNETKPYVVYGYAHVPAGKTLTITEGTKVHFHDGAGIIVDVGARIVIDGNVSTYDAEGQIIDDNEVTFEGDRLEPGFSEVPGQWATILILSEGDNQIDHLTLKNSTVGLFLPGAYAPDFRPKVTVTNSQIYNSSNVGILGRNANITGENVVINYAGQACFAGTEGGSYSMTHCTFNNNWQSSDQLAVLLDNYSVVNQLPVERAVTLASFKNSIIYGTNQVELLVDFIGNTPFDQSAFQNCLIKFNDQGTALEDDPIYDFIRNPTPANGNIKNQDPQFSNPNRNQLYIPLTSPAYNTGNPAVSALVPFDILNFSRAGQSDMGAYNAFEF